MSISSIFPSTTYNLSGRMEDYANRAHLKPKINFSWFYISLVFSNWNKWFNIKYWICFGLTFSVVNQNWKNSLWRVQGKRTFVPYGTIREEFDRLKLLFNRNFSSKSCNSKFERRSVAKRFLPIFFQISAIWGLEYHFIFW